MRKELLALPLFLAIPLAAQANPIAISATNGSNLSATAEFALVGSNLQLTLSNLSLADVLVPADVLTALFFDSGAGVTLTPVSARLAERSTVFFGPDGGGNVWGEWAYLGGLSGAPRGATQGISSAGFRFFGAGNFPSGANLQNHRTLGGLNYGLTFSYAGPSNLSDVSNASFQHGKSLNRHNLTSNKHNLTVPDGGMTITLLGLALAALGLVARRKK